MPCSQPDHRNSLCGFYKGCTALEIELLTLNNNISVSLLKILKLDGGGYSTSYSFTKNALGGVWSVTRLLFNEALASSIFWLPSNIFGAACILTIWLLAGQSVYPLLFLIVRIRKWLVPLSSTAIEGERHLLVMIMLHQLWLRIWKNYWSKSHIVYFCSGIDGLASVHIWSPFSSLYCLLCIAKIADWGGSLKTKITLMSLCCNESSDRFGVGLRGFVLLLPVFFQPDWK